MSDNLQDASSDVFALSGWHVLMISGRDALAFAQAQFMNDVAALAPGQWQWNGWLTAKGRVIALFALLRVDLDTLYLVLPDADPTDISSQLQKYVFRSKVSLSVRDDLYVSGSFKNPSHAAGAQISLIESCLELDFSGDGGSRTLRLDVTPAPVHSASESLWNEQDLAHGLPRLPALQREQWTPQQLSLDRLRAFSVKKGCYPGQEIVARTHFLGQVKRGLAIYEAASDLMVGSDVVVDAERSLGKIICTAGVSALAVVPVEAPTEELSCCGIALKHMPLLGGLAR